MLIAVWEFSWGSIYTWPLLVSRALSQHGSLSLTFYVAERGSKRTRQNLPVNLKASLRPRLLSFRSHSIHQESYKGQLGFKGRGIKVLLSTWGIVNNLLPSPNPLQTQYSDMFSVKVSYFLSPYPLFIFFSFAFSIWPSYVCVYVLIFSLSQPNINFTTIGISCSFQALKKMSGIIQKYHKYFFSERMNRWMNPRWI